MTGPPCKDTWQTLLSAFGSSLYTINQEKGEYVILSGAHPGEGLRGVSEANAMYDYATEVLGSEPEKDRSVPPFECGYC
jgi:hypothetical protein